MDRLAGLALFVRVVETGSFSKAADDLGIAQPTATKAVAAIEQRLGARLLHRSTRGITPTEVGALYYETCKRISRDVEDAENLATLLQSGVGGRIRISTSLTFGHCVMVPLALRYMQAHPDVGIDLAFDDRHVNLVEQGVDLAVRMGRLADSTLGSRHLGINPWVMVGSPAYLDQHAAPRQPADLAAHQSVIYSSVQGDDRWSFTGPGGGDVSVAVAG
ncbi:MAG: LysR family transcriptional regulator, partial [Rubrivivax sp.]